MGQTATLPKSRLSRETRHRDLLIACLLFAITVAIYSRAMFNPFLGYDDNGYVTQNQHVRAGLSWRTLPWAITTTEADNWHPLTWISHALDCRLYGMNAVGHHVTNVLLHAFNVVLLFVLLRRLTGAAGRSLLVAALFALHPINVESVAWIAERKNVLCTLFFLFTLAAYAVYAQRPGIQRYLVVIVLFMLGLAAKPMVITLPLILLFLDVWPLQRVQEWGTQVTTASTLPLKKRGKRKERAEASNAENFEPSPIPQVPLVRLILEKLPLLLLCVGSAVVTIVAQRTNSIRTLQRFPLGVRLENAMYAYADYIWKAFWPTQLSAFYPHPGDSLSIWQLSLSGIFLIAVSIFVWKQRFRRRYLVTGWLWYLTTLIPVIGLVQVGDQAMADRYAYIPLIGVFVMVVWGLADLADAKRINVQWRAVCAIVVLGILGLLTWRQIRFWDSDYDLWAHTLEVTPHNFIGQENFSKALAALGRVDEALPGLEEAARRNPNDPNRHVNYGSELVAVGRLDDAIVEYQKAIEVASNISVYQAWKDVATRTVKARSYESLATIYDELGDYTQVRENYRQGLKAAPEEASGMIQRMSESAADDPSAPNYLQLGILMDEAGRAPEAKSAYEQALKLDPTLEVARQSLEALDGRAK